MPQAQNSERRIAMLVDGDNAQHSLIEQMLEEASRYGTVSVRRAYGDWTQPNLSNWRAVMLAHAIQPIQQWRYTTGKNATDSALIIDAMDILYSGAVQGFCIVSSDSDYTRLCIRIKEAGFFVMGMGHKVTPEAFVKACDVFVHVENLVPPSKTSPPQKVEPQKTQPQKAEPQKTQPQKAQPQKAEPQKAQPQKANGNHAHLLSLFRRAFNISEQDDDGWVHLAPLGDALRRLDPSFDSRTYGHRTLSLLMKSLPDQFEVKTTKKTGASTMYARMKDKT